MLSVVFALFDVFNSIFLENVENTNNNKRETDNKHSSNNSDKSTNSLNIIADTSIAPLDIRRFSSFLDSNEFILPLVVRITVEISFQLNALRSTQQVQYKKRLKILKYCEKIKFC